jgi:hypothetical protein
MWVFVRLGESEEGKIEECFERWPGLSSASLPRARKEFSP